jgi:beta-lactamase regulating signal transducer with metallopeptidase domain
METVSHLVLTFLLNSLWQVTGVACVAAFCAWLMRNAPAWYRHLIWVMALGVSVLLPLKSVRSGWSTGSFPTLVSSTASHGELQSSPDLPGQARSGIERAYTNNGWAWKTVGSAGILDFLRHRDRRITLAPYLSFTALGVYVLSLVFHSRRLWRAWRKTIAIGRSGYAREIPAAIAGAATRCLATLGLRNVPILASASATGPMTLGARRPVIILPETFFQEASAEEAMSVFAHETAHILRRDFLMNLIYELLALPIAFHPAAVLLKRRINETRELACDEIATSRFTRASDYANSLVALARKMSAPLAFARSSYLLGIFDANILEERIMRILDQKHRLDKRLAKATLTLGAFLMAASCILASAFSLSISQEKNTQGDDALKLFVGTWNAKLKGKPYVTVTLGIADHKLTGKVTSYRVVLDDNGHPAEVNPESDVCTIKDSKVDGKNLTLSSECPGGQARQFAIKSIGDTELEMRVMGVPPPPDESGDNPHGLKLTKEAEGPSQIPGGVMAFAGTWEAIFNGKPFTTLKLVVDGDKLTGTMSPCRIMLDGEGKLTSAERNEQGGGWKIVDATFDGGRLLLKAKEDGSEDIDQFEMKLTGNNAAEFKPAGTPMPVEPWRMTRYADKPTTGVLVPPPSPASLSKDDRLIIEGKNLKASYFSDEGEQEKKQTTAAAEQTREPRNETIEEIIFRGNRQIPAPILRARMAIHKGDVYDENLLRHDFRALWKTDLLDAVRFEVSNGEKGKIVTIFVHEKKVVRANN